MTEQASLALRFVQDEVRYQGLHDGMGAFKPTDPSLVFDRRFGDCKDKSFLLHFILTLMDIPSTPVLVHSRHGLRLPEGLPTPWAFDHVILQISIDGSSYWVDPTLTLQGGSLQDNYFPNYEWGLPISKNSGLVSLPKYTLKKPVEVETSVVISSPTHAEVKIQTTCYGVKADRMRWYLGNAGLQRLSEESLKLLKKKYGKVISIVPLSVSDDRRKNLLITTASYSIPTRDRSGEKILKNHSITLGDLDDDVNLDRSSPYALRYPLWIKEHITIKNFLNHGPAESESLTREHSSMRYRYAYKAEGENTDIQYELQHLKDHIPVDDISDYLNILDEIYATNVAEIKIESVQ